MKIATLSRAAFGVLQGHLFKKPRPLFLILSLTNACDASCRYCLIPRRQTSELSTFEVFNLIDQAVKLGVQRIGLWGGEPLLRKDLAEIIQYGKKQNLYLTLDSNGHQLPEKIAQLKGLDHLILSLDGDKKAHDQNRQPGSFSKVLKALELAPRHFRTWTITVLTRHNLDQLDFILKLAKKLNFVATFQLLHHNPNLGENRELMPAPEDYRKALKYLIEKKKAGSPIGTSLACLESLLNWEDYSRIYLKKEPSPTSPSCWAGKFFFNVDTDGKVYPCSLLVEQLPGIDFREKGLKKALEQMPAPPCNSCLATCYTEYKLLFNLHFPTILEWIKAVRRWKKF